MTDEEVYEEWKKNSLEADKKIKQWEKNRKKEAKRFHNKDIGRLYLILKTLFISTFIWYIIHQYLMSGHYDSCNHSQFKNPDSYGVLYMHTPFVISISLLLICSALRSIDDKLKNK